MRSVNINYVNICGHIKRAAQDRKKNCLKIDVCMTFKRKLNKIFFCVGFNSNHHLTGASEKFAKIKMKYLIGQK